MVLMQEAPNHFVFSAHLEATAALENEYAQGQRSGDISCREILEYSRRGRPC